MTTLLNKIKKFLYRVQQQPPEEKLQESDGCSQVMINQFGSHFYACPRSIVKNCLLKMQMYNEQISLRMTQARTACFGGYVMMDVDDAKISACNN